MPFSVNPYFRRPPAFLPKQSDNMREPGKELSLIIVSGLAASSFGTPGCSLMEKWSFFDSLCMTGSRRPPIDKKKQYGSI